MLAEGVQIMREAWRDGVATFAGEHYQVEGAICRPQPLQAGGPPLWIAGGGERKTLRIAAEHAAYTNFAGTPEAFAHKSQVLERHCRDIGRDPAEIVRSANYGVVIGRDEAEVEDRLRQIESRYAPYLAPDGLAREVATFREGHWSGRRSSSSSGCAPSTGSVSATRSGTSPTPRTTAAGSTCSPRRSSRPWPTSPPGGWRAPGAPSSARAGPRRRRRPGPARPGGTAPAGRGGWWWCRRGRRRSRPPPRWRSGRRC